MSRLRVAVVGDGHLGKEHARVYASMPDVTLVGVVDPAEERGATVAGRVGARHFQDPAGVLPLVDAVSIAVPTPRHCEVALPFLEAGKAVLIEKPLAATLEEADRIIAAAERSGAILQVGHIERFNPIIVAAKPKLGTPVFIECDRIHPFSLRSTDVSVVLDLMIHDLDLVLYFTDDDWEEIEAAGASVLSPTDDLATARIVFRNGCIAMVKTSRVAMNRSRKIRVFSERSYVSMDLVAKAGMRIHLRDGYDPAAFLDAGGRITAPEGEAEFLARHVRTEFLEAHEGEPLALELRSFVDSAIARTTPSVTGMHGRRAMAAAAIVEERIRAQKERFMARGRRPRA